MNNQQVNKLAKALSKAAITPAPPKKNKKKKKKPKKNTQRTAGTYGQSVSERQGTITFSRVEFVSEVTKKSGQLELSPSAFPFLKGLSAHFERYRWNKLNVSYKPSVGTTTAGAVTLGIDWTSSLTPADRSAVTALTPLVDCPVWQNTKMSLPTSRLQSRRDYIITSEDKNDAQPGRLCWATSAEKGPVGDIWVEYTIQMFGTR